MRNKKKTIRKSKTFSLDIEIVEQFFEIIEEDGLKAGRTLEKIMLSWVEMKNDEKSDSHI